MPTLPLVSGTFFTSQSIVSYVRSRDRPASDSAAHAAAGSSRSRLPNRTCRARPARRECSRLRRSLRSRCRSPQSIGPRCELWRVAASVSSALYGVRVSRIGACLAFWPFAAPGSPCAASRRRASGSSPRGARDQKSRSRVSGCPAFRWGSWDIWARFAAFRSSGLATERYRPGQTSRQQAMAAWKNVSESWRPRL